MQQVEYGIHAVKLIKKEQQKENEHLEEIKIVESWGRPKDLAERQEKEK